LITAQKLAGDLSRRETNLAPLQTNNRSADSETGLRNNHARWVNDKTIRKSLNTRHLA